MTSIFVEAKGPKGIQAKESLLPTAVSGYQRGLAVTYGDDAYHATLSNDDAGHTCLGILEEDAISLENPCSVIEFGQAVAQIGADVGAGQLLAVDALGRLVAAEPGDSVVAVALEAQTYVSPGSFCNVFVFAMFGIPVNQNVGAGTDQYSEDSSSGGIPVTSGTYALLGSGAQAMTLAAPTAGQDGTRIYVVAGTAHAHTITTPAAAINGTHHIVTFAAIGDGVELEAVNGIWVTRSVSGPTPAVVS